MIDLISEKSLYNQFNKCLADKRIYLRNSGINEFGYRQFLASGKTIGFCTNENWNKLLSYSQFAQVMTQHYTSELQKITSDNLQYCIRIGSAPTTPFLQALYDNNLWNTLAIYKIHDNKIEGFYFISSKEHSEVISYYLNNLYQLECFINSVKPIFNTILADTSYNNQYIDLNLKQDLLNDPATKVLNRRIPVIKSDSINVNYLGRNIIFTKRELECLLFIALGYSYKELAANLKISVRTIEKYLAQLKGKIGVHNKSQLVEFTYKTELYSLIKTD